MRAPEIRRYIPTPASNERTPPIMRKIPIIKESTPVLFVLAVEVFTASAIMSSLLAATDAAASAPIFSKSILSIIALSSTSKPSSSLSTPSLYFFFYYSYYSFT